MKKLKYLSIICLLIMLSACSKAKQPTNNTDTSNIGVVIKEKKEKHSTIVNNMLVGRSKISFNNKKYDVLSQGKFAQDTLWGTFEQENNSDTYIQIDAFDNIQDMYGEISGYTLDGVDWAEEKPVNFHDFEEEATQLSRDKKVYMYKARTDDIIFSVTMFGKEKLTTKQILDLEQMAKSIKVENVADQITSESNNDVSQTTEEGNQT